MKRLLLVLLTICMLGLAAGCGQTNDPTDGGEISAPDQFRSDELEKYTIVYGENNPQYAALANGLADHILEKYDRFLSVACDTDAPAAAYEIILGDTNRCEQQGRIMEYAVTVEEGRLLISAGGAFSLEQALNDLCVNVLNGQRLKQEKGVYNQVSFLIKSQPVSEGTTARVMSANVLADAFADSAYKDASYRAEIFAGTLLSYTPDVVGLQETDENWNTVLDAYIEKMETIYGISYARHLAAYEEQVNYTSLLYRSDKFQAQDSGVNVFNWWKDEAFHHNYHMRNISWAQFSSVTDPDAVFIVANTHWSYRTEHDGGNTFLAGADKPIATNELRQQCKDETNAFMTSLRNKYPEMPIFLTGDFNTSLPFFTESGWTPAEFRVISEEAKENGKSISLVPESGHFDHIFGAGSYIINLYGFFYGPNYHDLMTDHPFVYVDLTF